MLVLDTIHDEAPEDAEALVVDDDRRRRSRFRAETESGREVGVVRDGDRPLADGDVLGTEDRPVVVVQLETTTAAVVDVGGLDPTTDRLLAMAEAGHALGNRHRPLAVRDTELLVPVTDGRDRLRSELEAALPAATDVGFEEVDPGLFDDDDHAHEHRGIDL